MRTSRESIYGTTFLKINRKKQIIGPSQFVFLPFGQNFWTVKISIFLNKTWNSSSGVNILSFFSYNVPFWVLFYVFLSENVQILRILFDKFSIFAKSGRIIFQIFNIFEYFQSRLAKITVGFLCFVCLRLPK